MRPSETELRKTWRHNWLHSIFEYANPALQRKSWIEGPRADWPEGRMWQSSPVECMCSYFDDLDLKSGYADLVRDGWVSVEEARLAAAFHRLADGYPLAGRGRNILNDPEWAKVVRHANVLWHSLNAIMHAPEDAATINDLENTYGPVEKIP
jgi:hypothetical protein